MLFVNIALFVHMLGVVTLFTALAIVQRSGARARRASTVEDARTWFTFAGTTRPMFMSSFFMILLSGLYMTYKLYSLRTPWIMVAMTIVLLLPLIGGLGVGRALSGVERDLQSGSGPLTSEQKDRICRPGPWVTSGALNGVAIGLLWIMVSKPGPVHTLVAVALPALLGAVVASIEVRSVK